MITKSPSNLIPIIHYRNVPQICIVKLYFNIKFLIIYLPLFVIIRLISVLAFSASTGYLWLKIACLFIISSIEILLHHCIFLFLLPVHSITGFLKRRITIWWFILKEAAVLISSEAYKLSMQYKKGESEWVIGGRMVWGYVLGERITVRWRVSS